jgi:hypothetical protein
VTIPQSRPKNPTVTVGSTTWLLWRSDTGARYATRCGKHLTEDQIRAGCEMTVAADSIEELTHLLRAQPDPDAAGAFL